MIILDQLQKIYGNAPRTRLVKYFPDLMDALQEAKIDTPTRISAFLAQIGHESYELKYMSEIWGPTPQQLKYDPPSKLAAILGNLYPGDGMKFRGSV